MEFLDRIGVSGRDLRGVNNWFLRTWALAALIGVINGARAETFCSQTPPAGGGTMRSSQFWIDPSGQGNELNGDSACYADFVLTHPSEITHVEWWGDSNPNQGFQLEVWPQDPGTIAYQPLAVFRRSGIHPTWSTVLPSVFNEPHSSGTTHYSVDLPTPILLPANNASNVRWFFAVIGRTTVPYQLWNWARGNGGSNRSYQWIREGYGGGDLFRSLPEGRALVLSGNSSLPFLSGTVTLLDWLDSGALADFTLTPVNGGLPTETQAVIQTDGTFSFQTGLEGEYSIAIKVSHWLRQLLVDPIVIGASGVSGLEFVLINGDVDHDNEVGPGDFGELASAFGSADGDDNWNPEADLDGDQEVGPSDFGVLSTNFGTVGD